MNLKKLELFGFKSFMRKLDIHFSDGITVIVGPNGCGKTNVTDAVRWVLGESNARNLRGVKMEDLIFNGTHSYKPLNVAEVELTIDNSSGVLPTEFTEVTVARRVYRSGESEFLINKIPSRRRDVHELFMDTGLGSRAYSVIERDMVEMVLADQPEKRREMIEEAAGIHKYKIRERQARRKLESTDEDLHRISDVLREVERQVRSLKRQVGAAKRFQEVRDRQRELEVSLAFVELEEIGERVLALRTALDENSTERDGAGAKVSAIEAEIEALRTQAARAERELSDAQREVDRLADAARSAEGENLVRRERRESQLETARRLAAEKTDIQERIREGTERRAGMEDQHRLCAQKLRELEEKLEEEEASLGRMDSDLESRRTELSRAREAVEDSAQDVGRLRTELANLDARSVHLEERDTVLQAESEQLERKLQAERAELEAATTGVDEFRQRLAGLDGELKTAVARQEETDDRREAARAEEAKLSVDAESARSALEMLRGLQESYEGYGQGARTLLNRRDGLRPLADAVRPSRPDLITALDAALEGLIEYVVAPSSPAAVQAVQSLRGGEGRATIVDIEGFRHGAATRAKYAIPSDPAMLGTARSFLEVDGDLGAVLDDLLSRTLIVETLEDAMRFARDPEARGFRFVSRGGDWVEHPGIVHGGSPRASDDSRLLGRAARVEEMSARVANAEEHRGEARRALERLAQERDGLSARIEQLRSGRDESRERLSERERDVERVRTEIGAMESRVESVRTERTELDGVREELAREKRARIAAVEEAEEKRGRLEESWHRRESEIVDSSAMRDHAQHACHEFRLEAERARGELQKTDLEVQRLDEARRADEEGIARREEELLGTERGIGDLDREIDAADVRISGHARALEERKSGRDRLANARAQLIEKLRRVEEQRGSWSRLRDESAELAHRNEMELQRIESSRDEMVGRVERDFEVNLALPGAREAYGVFCEADAETVEAARREREGLRRQIDRMGAVNLVALEQHERESKRFEFLKVQKEDLEEAREKLRRTIRKVNRTARTLFMQTLDDVRRNFQQTFGTLFEGGQADIRLAGDEDPLHASIEVFARPRGKRLNNISLMSSGERSLTAVAFLFAIYLVKPSPFCILDEVDAPLDDANIGRFLEMLKKVARQTQFVMITHNKKTMEVADFLYGVTMQEPGVSQLVSVRLGPEGGDSGGNGHVELPGEESGAEAAGELVAEGSA